MNRSNAVWKNTGYLISLMKILRQRISLHGFVTEWAPCPIRVQIFSNSLSGLLGRPPVYYLARPSLFRQPCGCVGHSIVQMVCLHELVESILSSVCYSITRLIHAWLHISIFHLPRWCPKFAPVDNPSNKCRYLQVQRSCIQVVIRSRRNSQP